MAKTPKTQQASEFHLRPGVPPFGPLGWRGVNTEVEPGSLDANELIRGEDIRLRGKTIFTRPGMDKVVDLSTILPVDADSLTNHAVNWMKEAPGRNPSVRLWAASVSTYGGPRLRFHDSTLDPEVQAYLDLRSDTGYQPVLAKYGADLFMGFGDTVYEVMVTSPPPGVASSRIHMGPAITPRLAFPGYIVRSMLEFDSLLFIGLENASVIASSKIVSWNGTGTVDELTAIRPPLAMGLWRDRLVVGFDATAANVQRRAFGAAPGSWAAFSLAGFQCAAYQNSMVAYRYGLYIAGGNDKIYRYSSEDGGLALVRTIAGCATDGLGVTALTVHNGLLYYGWNAATTYATKIGRYDPDSSATDWIDSYKDVTGDEADFTKLTSMLSHRQQIFIGGVNDWVVATAVNDVKGDLEVYDDSEDAINQVGQLLRYP